MLDKQCTIDDIVIIRESPDVKDHAEAWSVDDQGNAAYYRYEVEAGRFSLFALRVSPLPFYECDGCFDWFMSWDRVLDHIDDDDDDDDGGWLAPVPSWFPV